MKELTKILSKQNISVLTSLDLSYKTLAKAGYARLGELNPTEFVEVLVMAND